MKVSCFEVPLQTSVAVNKKTMKLIHDIEDLEPSIKDKLIFLANAVIRDAKTGKAYAR